MYIAIYKYIIIVKQDNSFQVKVWSSLYNNEISYFLCLVGFNRQNCSAGQIFPSNLCYGKNEMELRIVMTAPSLSFGKCDAHSSFSRKCFLALSTVTVVRIAAVTEAPLMRRT